MRFPAVLLSALAAALALASIASAHVKLDPAQARAGSYAKFVIRVPTEEPTAATVKVTVQVPPAITSISFQPKPGWKRTVTIQKLAKPVTIDGATVSSRIDTVTWTSAGAKIGPGEFDEFGIVVAMPGKAGSTLAFPAVQTYANGKVVRWIGPAGASEPAPTVSILPAAKGGG